MKEGISSKSGVPPKRGVIRFWLRHLLLNQEGRTSPLLRAASRGALWWPTSHGALYSLYSFY